ncbi:hypothetical protein BDA96_10G057500 [Sorghum bicolor]|uniref:Uncharacterized protein n=1 Tax=Sorghum bicolor TaxID=4558 RepID=A0A921Q185_SORBI|nr:hypothetical protein BDA96_10G057500 [Sorghum bicolor]KAG0512933.1 hypothetical protein BDA96_10G057500 [Sorghum bicolor]
MCLSMDGPRPWRGQRRAEAWLRSRSPSSSTLSPPLWAHMLGRPGGLDVTGIGKDQSQINCSSSTNMISPSIGNASMNNQRGHVSKKWWYMGCELCKKRLHNEGGSYYCQPCDCRSAIPMYKFSLIAADETAEARFFCHDIVAHHLICRNYNSLLKPISYPPGLPAQMLAIIPRKYMFPVGLTV